MWMSFHSFDEGDDDEELDLHGAAEGGDASSAEDDRYDPAEDIEPQVIYILIRQSCSMYSNNPKQGAYSSIVDAKSLQTGYSKLPTLWFVVCMTSFAL